MNVEALDGFFTVFIAGLETVMPNEYYREVFGGEMSDTCEFGCVDRANDVYAALEHHRSKPARERSQPAQAYGSGAFLYFLYPSAVSRITPRTCSSTSPSFLNSAIAKRAEEESTVCLDKVTN